MRAACAELNGMSGSTDNLENHMAEETRAMLGLFGVKMIAAPDATNTIGVSALHRVYEMYLSACVQDVIAAVGSPYYVIGHGICFDTWDIPLDQSRAVLWEPGVAMRTAINSYLLVAPASAIPLGWLGGTVPVPDPRAQVEPAQPLRAAMHTSARLHAGGYDPEDPRLVAARASGDGFNVPQPHNVHRVTRSEAWSAYTRELTESCGTPAGLGYDGTAASVNGDVDPETASNIVEAGSAPSPGARYIGRMPTHRGAEGFFDSGFS
jgi:hypothetical protein